MSDSGNNNDHEFKNNIPVDENREAVLEEELSLTQQARSKGSYSFFASLMAIVTGLLVGVIILLIANPARAGQG